MPILSDAAIGWIRRVLPQPLTRTAAIGIGGFFFMLGAFARMAFQSWIGLGEVPFLSFFPMLLFAGLMGGGAGGLACLIASVLWSVYVILPPGFGMALTKPEELAKLGLFILAGGLIAYTGALLRDVILRLDDLKMETERWASARDQTARELEHRIKNLFGIVLGIAHRSARSAGAPKAFMQAFEPRILALAGAQNLLAAQRWTGARVAEVIGASLGPFEQACPGQIHVEAGADAIIAEQSAVSLALALHELATNAMKYGALSQRSGLVRLQLSLERGGRRLALRWQEEGGPPATPPAETGFGTELIKGAFAEEREAEVTLSYREEGLACLMAYRLADGDEAAARAAPAAAPQPHLQPD